MNTCTGISPVDVGNLIIFPYDHLRKTTKSYIIIKLIRHTITASIIDNDETEVHDFVK